MPRALWLPDVARDAGLNVRTSSGWKTRGSPDFAPAGLVVHHTATPPSWTSTQLERLLVRGHSTVPGPLCHYQLDRDGTVVVIAAGRANHAGQGSWRGLTGNRSVVGIEAANTGTGEPWPAVQLDAYDRLSAAVLARLGLPADRMCAHREWTPRKSDPRGIDMDAMRARVARLLTEERLIVNQQDEDRIRAIIREEAGRAVWSFKGRDEPRDAYDYLRKLANDYDFITPKFRTTLRAVAVKLGVKSDV